MQREFSLLLSLCQGLSLAVLGKEPKTPYFLAVNICAQVSRLGFRLWLVCSLTDKELGFLKELLRMFLQESNLALK